MSCAPTGKRNSPGWDRDVRRVPTAIEVARVWRGYGKDAALERWQSFGERFLSDLEKSVPGSLDAKPSRRNHTPEQEEAIATVCETEGYAEAAERFGVTIGFLAGLMRRMNRKVKSKRVGRYPDDVEEAMATVCETEGYAVAAERFGVKREFLWSMMARMGRRAKHVRFGPLPRERSEKTPPAGIVIGEVRVSKATTHWKLGCMGQLDLFLEAAE